MPISNMYHMYLTIEFSQEQVNIVFHQIKTFQPFCTIFFLDQLLLQQECVVPSASRNALCWHRRQRKKSHLFSCFREGLNFLLFEE